MHELPVLSEEPLFGHLSFSIFLGEQESGIIRLGKQSKSYKEKWRMSRQSNRYLNQKIRIVTQKASDGSEKSVTKR